MKAGYPFYQDDVLDILSIPYENSFRITSTKYLVFLKNNQHISIYPNIEPLSISDCIYANSTSLSFKDFFPGRIDLYSETNFNKLIDRILSMQVFS